MTMGEPAEQLDASVGAMSGAIRTLSSVGLAERVPAHGSLARQRLTEMHDFWTSRSPRFPRC